MTAPELSVVCKNCGEEVSPYVTECPYCGTRLRKRAPRLERQGDEIRVHESRREKRRRERRERREQRDLRERPRLRLPSIELGDRPVATIAVLLGTAALMVVQRAADLRLEQVGAIVGPIGSEYWRYLAAPFVYDTLGFVIVVGVAIAILGTAVEARLGTVATLALIVACGSLGMLVADRAASAGLDDFLLAAGGNGIALGLLGAWLALRRAENRRSRGEPDPIDLTAVSIAAVVLLLVPLFERTADPIAGVVGGLVGLGLGAIGAIVAGRAGRA